MSAFNVTHIIKHYNDLAPITIFSLGSVLVPEQEYMKCKKLNLLVSNLETTELQDTFPVFASSVKYFKYAPPQSSPHTSVIAPAASRRAPAASWRSCTALDHSWGLGALLGPSRPAPHHDTLRRQNGHISAANLKFCIIS